MRKLLMICVLLTGCTCATAGLAGQLDAPALSYGPLPQSTPYYAPPSPYTLGAYNPVDQFLYQAGRSVLGQIVTMRGAPAIGRAIAGGLWGFAAMGLLYPTPVR